MATPGDVAPRFYAPPAAGPVAARSREFHQGTTNLRISRPPNRIVTAPGVIAPSPQGPSRADIRALQRLDRLQQRTRIGRLNRSEQRQLRVLEQRQARQPLRQQVQPLHAETEQHRLRRNGAKRVTPQAAAQGRFAAWFQNRPGRRLTGREDSVAAHQAWRKHRHAGFVPWVGALYWPYAYSDIFDYTFWPYGYDEGFWAYAYDDFFDAVFWPNGGPYADYAYAGPYGGDVVGALPGMRSTSRIRAARQLAQQLCNDPTKGVTAWPFARIEKSVVPNADQKALLDELKNAVATAADRFRVSCPNDIPMTPISQLNAVLARLEATRDAVRSVRPALERFYASLSDEQKARFNAIGPDFGRLGATAARNETQEPDTVARCGDAKMGLVNLPIERIEDAVQPTDDQQSALDRLGDATAKAVTILQAACPDAIALTPVGRMEAMEKRLDALIAAGQTLRPALVVFYAVLKDEQRARFNILSRQPQSGG